MRVQARWLVSLLALPAVLVMTASPASASATTCDIGEWCVWSGQFGGAFDQVLQVNLGSGDPDLSNNTYDTDTSRRQNNTISSVYNRTNRYVKLYDLTGHRALMGCIGPGIRANLVGLGWGDRTSSYIVQGNTSGC